MAMNSYEEKLRKQREDRIKDRDAALLIFDYGEGTVYPSQKVPHHWNNFVKTASESEIIKDSMVETVLKYADGETYGKTAQSSLEFQMQNTNGQADLTKENCNDDLYIGPAYAYQSQGRQKFSISSKGKFKFYFGSRENVDPSRQKQYVWCHRVPCAEGTPGAEHHEAYWRRSRRDIWVQWLECAHSPANVDKCQYRQARHKSHYLTKIVPEEEVYLEGYTDAPNGWFQGVADQKEVFEIA